MNCHHENEDGRLEVEVSKFVNKDLLTSSVELLILRPTV